MTLDVGDAARQGWRAFRRAPWVFVGFALLLMALQLIGEALGGVMGTLGGPLGGLATLLFAVLRGLLNLWGLTGLVRGAWVALEGGSPTLATFCRWDGSALLRLLLPSLLLTLLLGLLLLPVLPFVTPILLLLSRYLTAGTVPNLVISPLVAIVLLGAGLVFTYVSVSQLFLGPIALLEGSGPLNTLQRGRQVVDPQWWRVLWLVSVESAVLLLGALACGVGILVALPVVSCINLAAYRQMFGSRDRSGLISGRGRP